ncbi:MAG: hypothetical protein QXV69_05545 [Sulfolobaceae archaeon]
MESSTTRRKQQKQKKKRLERIDAFKKELKALAFEPIYGNSIKEIAANLTIKIQEIAEEYGYKVEFPEKAEVEIEGDIYYFSYPIKVITSANIIKRIKILVQYMLYDEKRWIGMITDIE